MTVLPSDSPLVRWATLVTILPREAGGGGGLGLGGFNYLFGGPTSSGLGSVEDRPEDASTAKSQGEASAVSPGGNSGQQRVLVN